MHTTILKTFILHKKVHILCNTSYELNKNVSKTVKNRTEIVIQTLFLFYFYYTNKCIIELYLLVILLNIQIISNRLLLISRCSII